MASPKNPHAVALRKIKSGKRSEASRINGSKGGRPTTINTMLWALADDVAAVIYYAQDHRDEEKKRSDLEEVIAVHTRRFQQVLH